jgi:hypothetical protein
MNHSLSKLAHTNTLSQKIASAGAVTKKAARLYICVCDVSGGGGALWLQRKCALPPPLVIIGLRCGGGGGGGGDRAGCV